MHSLHSSKTKQNHKKNKKIAKFARNYKTLDKEMFYSDLKNMNWKEILKIERALTKKLVRFYLELGVS